MAVVSGGTTLIDNGALDSAVPSGKLILLSTQTASSSANISFTSGINSTYDSYVFKFINIHPQTDNPKHDDGVLSDDAVQRRVQAFDLVSDFLVGEILRRQTLCL